MNQDNFATPFWLFAKYRIDPNLDVCASPENTKASEFFTEKDNALTRSWIGKEGFNTVVWCNPPHSKNKEFVEKAYKEFMALGIKIYLLIPLNTLSSKYAFKYIHGVAEITFIEGRIKFLDPDTHLISKYPSRNGYVLVTFNKKHNN